MSLAARDAGEAELETERLHLRTLRGGDAAAVLAYYDRNRAHLKPWEPDPPPGFFTLDYWERSIAEAIRERELGTRLRFVAFARDRATYGQDALALVNLHRIQRGVAQSALLGYSADRRVEGRGLAREAVRAVVEYALETLDLHRVEANYQPMNERSGKLLRALGFNVEGYARDYLYLNGAWRDHVLTSRIREPNERR